MKVSVPPYLFMKVVTPVKEERGEMKQLEDPKKVVDSVVDGTIGAIQFFPRAAENIAKVADAYAVSANKNINDFKAKMPDEPAVIPRLVFSVIGETIGAGIGIFEAVIKAGSDTASDVKSQIKRVTG